MTKVLVVEDNPTIAELIADLLKANGYEVSGTARTVSEAVGLYHTHHPEHAIVDIYLADDLLGTELLCQLGHPPSFSILFASDIAYGISLTRLQGHAVIRKPFRARDLLDALKIVIEVCHDGSSSLPYPPGFRLLDVPAI